MESDATGALATLLDSLERVLAKERAADRDGWELFKLRLRTNFGHLYPPLKSLYGERPDFATHLCAIVTTAAAAWFARSPALRARDRERETHGDWYLDHRMIGGVCYVDLYAGTLQGIRERLPAFEELGLTYLHLMPLFRSPAGANDGGYAVSSYREVDSRLGTLPELAELAEELHGHGISLVLDFVFNHTSDEHDWAIEARQFLDDETRNAYMMFPDRTMPDLFDATLREIFPDQRPGSFTWVPDAGETGRWVWTTFHSFQWDLNYANPHVFRRMAAEMFFLANQGVDVLRLDAVAFCWKRPGTTCESLPEVHQIVRAFNALTRIAAPALIFKSEAIVHPAEVASYIDQRECQLSYNPLLMALGWETLATRNCELLRQSMRHWFELPPGTAWVNYVRSHDDIGWTFDDADAAARGINGYDHRRFLNDFYTGRFEGSFARGLPLQANPRTGDSRISGTTASLAGLEKALAEEGPEQVELAIRRILLLHGLALTMGGIPLIYLGDELATLNDYSFRDRPSQAADSRWVHRVAFDDRRRANRRVTTTVEGRTFAGMRKMIQVRKRSRALAGSQTELIDTGNDHIFAFRRDGGGRTLLVFMNVTEQPQSIYLSTPGASRWIDELTGDSVGSDAELHLQPYQQRWLSPATATGGR